MSILRRITDFFRRPRLEREMNEELRFHIDEQTRQNIAGGMAPDEAERAARRQFGWADRIREEGREARGWSWLENFTRDVRHALRALRKSPGFTTVAVLSLALGIGANTAVFSLVNAILLRSLPVPNAHELRTLKWTGIKANFRWFTGAWFTDGDVSTGDAFCYPVFEAMRAGCADAAEVFAYKRIEELSLRVGSEAFMGEGTLVSDNFFAGLGIQPLFGRTIGPEDAQAGTPLATVISWSLWSRYFDLDAGVLGRSVVLNGTIFTIVGVLPQGFQGVNPASESLVYVGTAAQPQLTSRFSLTSTDHWWIQVMARLRPHRDEARLQSSVDVVFAQHATGQMQSPEILIEDGSGGLAYSRDHYRRPLMILLAVVGMVILVACANLAGLSLARSTAREHELAVRASLGASRGRLFQQALTENLVLAVAGAALGMPFALFGRRLIGRLLAGPTEPLRFDTSLDVSVFAFTALVALATAVLSGLLPALRASRVDPQAGLKDRACSGAPRLRTGRILVVSQVAVSLLLVSGAGLYVRTLLNLVTIDTGFATDDLLVLQVKPRDAGYRGADATAFLERLGQAWSAIPGVDSVGLSQFPLLAGMMSGGSFFTLPAHPFEGSEKPSAHRLAVSESFFETMGIRVLLGRGLDATDVDAAPKAVVVNETFARKYLPNVHPIGETLRAGKDDWTIVGVCQDAHYTEVKGDAPPTVYFSYRQDSIGGAFFVLRTTLPPMALVPAARRALADIDSRVPLGRVTTQRALRDGRIGQEWMLAVLCGALASMAVLLCAIGVYGLLAYNVARRTAEIGVRMALGAQTGDVARPILREALLLAGIGSAVGLPAALALTQLIKSQLYGVTPTDPTTLAAGIGVLLVLATVAAWLPARRAARVDPMIALRSE